MKGLIRICGKGLNISVAAIFFLTILVGCVTKEARKDISDEELLLRERVMTYWQFRREDNLIKAYEIESPLYRKINKIDKYIRNINSSVVKVGSFDIKHITVGENSAIVKMSLKVRLNLPGIPRDTEIEAIIEDRWIKTEMNWYHVFPSEGLGN